MDLKAKLKSISTTSLLDGPTPIQRLHGIERRLGDKRRGVRIWTKRDDYMSLGGGGNKLRKLEFLLADAQSKRCDVVVAIGGIQSNFARLTAAACAKLGIDCELVLARMVDREGDLYEKNGNILLNHLFGAHIHLLAREKDALTEAVEIADQFRSQGRRPYIASLGGSTPLGCLGYVSASLEIMDQAKALGVHFSSIVTPNGSAGTQGGLCAGLTLQGLPATMVRGYTVLSAVDQAVKNTVEKANAALRLLGSHEIFSSSDINLSGDQLGDGYGVPTQAGMDAISMLASSEGLLLDPVYSGKAFAGLIQDMERGIFPTDSDVLFMMTGGSPGLFPYADAFTTKT